MSYFIFQFSRASVTQFTAIQLGIMTESFLTIAKRVPMDSNVNCGLQVPTYASTLQQLPPAKSMQVELFRPIGTRLSMKLINTASSKKMHKVDSIQGYMHRNHKSTEIQEHISKSVILFQVFFLSDSGQKLVKPV